MPPRGRGGKFSKPSRGGGKHFSRDLQPLDKEGNPLGMWRDPKDKAESSSDEEEEDSSEEESSEDDAGPSQAGASQEGLTREQRRELAKQKKQAAAARRNAKAAQPGDLPPSDSEEESDDDNEMPANPNHTAKARSQASAPVAAPKKAEGDPSNLSRREREALQAQQARERYQKMHAEGKTDEARADLARLKLIRERREAETARKAAEKEEREAREKATAAERDAREAKLRAAALGESGPKKGKKGK